MSFCPQTFELYIHIHTYIHTYQHTRGSVRVFGYMALAHRSRNRVIYYTRDNFPGIRHLSLLIINEINASCYLSSQFGNIGRVWDGLPFASRGLSPMASRILKGIGTYRQTCELSLASPCLYVCAGGFTYSKKIALVRHIFLYSEVCSLVRRQLFARLTVHLN